MLKSNSTISFIAMLLGCCLLPTPASAAMMPCKQVNEVRTIKQKEFVCSKSAGKLSWRNSNVGIPEVKLIDFMAIPDGFAIYVEDYDAQYGISASVATGDASVDETGMITVTGNLLPKDYLTVKVTKGKFFRLAKYSGEGFVLKTLNAPKFAQTLTLLADGFKVLITNYDGEQKYWEAETSRGSAVVTSDGYLWVKDLVEPGPVDIEFNISGDGYKSIKSNWSYVMPEIAVEPKLAEFTNLTASSMESQVLNFDKNLKWEVTSSVGKVFLSDSGKILVTGLNSNQTVSVYVSSTTKMGLVSSANVTGTSLAVFSSISERDWALIAKDPNGSIGKTVIIFGYITQFDAATGLDQFRADVNGIDRRNAFGFSGDNTFLTGSKDMLKGFVARDYFSAKVIVRGSQTYTTTLNGSLTVPKLEVVEINRL